MFIFTIVTIGRTFELMPRKDVRESVDRIPAIAVVCTAIMSTMKETQTQRPFLLENKNICETHCPQ